MRRVRKWSSWLTGLPSRGGRGGGRDHEAAVAQIAEGVVEVRVGVEVAGLLRPLQGFGRRDAPVDLEDADDDATIVFSGGIRISGKEKILESLATQPWKSFQIEDPQVISLSENAEVVVYRVTAQREGSEAYVAFISSTYVLNNGTWKLILHQQTPL